MFKYLLLIFASILFLSTLMAFDRPSENSVQIVKNADSELLTNHNVFSWPTWEKEPSEFIWQFSERELAYLLEGEVFVTPEGSNKTYHFKKGDLGYFEAGLRCKWEITKPLKKHVILEKNKFQEIYWKIVFKLQIISRFFLSLFGQAENLFMETALNT